MKNSFILFLFLFTFGGYAQDSTSTSGFSSIPNFDDSFRGKSAVRVVFYNVENLFDIYDDSTKSDEQFTPDGDHHWNQYKYNEKLQHISKTITAIGGWEPVSIIGLCEVENRAVLEDLLENTSLKQDQYTIVHQESPDNRGIDVAMLYRADKVILDTVQWLTVSFGPNSRPTRDILLARFTTTNNASLFVFFNHWPSRYGGQLISDPKRKAAAAVVRKAVDSISHVVPTPNILIMGDFNDYRDNESMEMVLGAKNDSTFQDSTTLYNLMFEVKSNEGTHKYQGSWGALDQIVVNKNIYHGLSKLKVVRGKHIFNAPFLLEDETKFPGQKPFRTYIGMKYNGGYSDHLPIFIDLHLL